MAATRMRMVTTGAATTATTTIATIDDRRHHHHRRHQSPNLAHCEMIKSIHVQRTVSTWDHRVVHHVYSSASHCHRYHHRRRVTKSTRIHGCVDRRSCRFGRMFYGVAWPITVRRDVSRWWEGIHFNWIVNENASSIISISIESGYALTNKERLRQILREFWIDHWRMHTELEHLP